MIRGGMVTLPVRDVGGAVRFYVETLGMKLVEDAGTDRAVIDAGDGLHLALRRGDAEATGVRIGLSPKVPIAEAIAILENRGVTFKTTKEGDITLAAFHDPDGNALYLYQRA